jgi:hypothetical protein
MGYEKKPPDRHPSEWVWRECRRFANGEYKPPLWNDAAWWGFNSKLRERHFAHVSKDDPSKLAYTPSERHGREDRQVKTRPGKYLNRYFSSVLSPDAIRDIATEWGSKAETLVFRLADTAEDIETVYRNGPESCMGKGHEFNTPVYPASVYAAGDLAVAYLGPIGDATARVIVWPEKKVWTSGTMYGDCVRLKEALRLAGYACGSVSGARIKRVESNGSIVTPYLSDYKATEHCSDTLLLTDSGGMYRCDSTSGWSNLAYPCAHCGEGCAEDETREVAGETWCECCYNNHASWCDSCECCYNSDDGGTCVDNEHHWCDDCVRRHATECDHCNEYTADRNVVEVGRESWCQSCWEDKGTICEQCQKMVDCDNTRCVSNNGSDECWCEDCADEYASSCDRCFGRFAIDGMTDGHCEDCAEEVAEEKRLALECAGQIPLPIIAGLSERSGGIAYI